MGTGNCWKKVVENAPGMVEDYLYTADRGSIKGTVLNLFLNNEIAILPMGK